MGQDRWKGHNLVTLGLPVISGTGPGSAKTGSNPGKRANWKHPEPLIIQEARKWEQVNRAPQRLQEVSQRDYKVREDAGRAQVKKEWAKLNRDRQVPGTAAHSYKAVKDKLGAHWAQRPTYHEPVRQYLMIREKLGPISAKEVDTLADQFRTGKVHRVLSIVASEKARKHSKHGADPGRLLNLGFSYLDLEIALQNKEDKIRFENGVIKTVDEALSVLKSKSGLSLEEFRALFGSNLNDLFRYRKRRYYEDKWQREDQERRQARDAENTSYGQWLGQKINIFDHAAKGMDKLANWAGEFAAEKYGKQYGVLAQDILNDPEMQEEIQKAAARLNIPVQAAAIIATIAVPELTIPMLIANYAPTALTALGTAFSTGETRKRGMEELKSFLQSYNPAQDDPAAAIMALVNLISLKGDKADLLEFAKTRSLRGTNTAGGFSDGSFRFRPNADSFKLNRNDDILTNVWSDHLTRKQLRKTPGLSEHVKDRYRAGLSGLKPQEVESALAQLDMIARTAVAGSKKSADEWLTEHLDRIETSGTVSEGALHHEMPTKLRAKAPKGSNKRIIPGKATPENIRRIEVNLDYLSAKHPDPYLSPAAYKAWSAEGLYNSNGWTIKPPANLLALRRNPMPILDQITTSQWDAIHELHENGRAARELLRQQPTTADTVKLVLSSSASRRRPVGVAEAAFTRLLGPELDELATSLMKGQLSGEQLAEFKKFAYRRLVGYPGFGAISNINQFIDHFVADAYKVVGPKDGQRRLIDVVHDSVISDTGKESGRHILSAGGSYYGPKASGFTGYWTGQLEPVAFDANLTNWAWTPRPEGRSPYSYLHPLFQGPTGVANAEAYRNSFAPVAERVMGKYGFRDNPLLALNQAIFQMASGQTSSHRAHLGELLSTSGSSYITSPVRKGDYEIFTVRHSDGSVSYAAVDGDGLMYDLTEHEYLTFRSIMKNGTIRDLQREFSSNLRDKPWWGPNIDEPRGDGGFSADDVQRERDGQTNTEEDVDPFQDGDSLEYSRNGGHALGTYSRDATTQAGIIQILEGANEATLPHEIGHFIRHKWLTGTELNRVERALGVRDGKWTRADEELFARIHENYLRTGLAPNKALKSVFQAFKVWMDKVYGDFRLEANDDVRRVLDKVYGRDKMDWRGLRKDLGGLRFRVTPNRKSGERDKNQSVFLDDGQYSVTLTPGEMRQFLAAR